MSAFVSVLKVMCAKEFERMDQENRQLASDALNLFADAINSSETAQDPPADEAD